MPTVLRAGPYRFFFYSSDAEEPRHVHVERDRAVSKFWLEPVRVEFSVGFSASEIRRIERMIAENRQILLEQWNEYFGR